MPRKSRLEIPGEVHHVMTRGLNGMTIFRDDADYEKMRSLFASSVEKFDARCYAWVLMPNHYHIVIRPGHGRLSAVFRRINTGYAMYYNRRYNRRGFVFQDRFKSIATQEYTYFRELIRYVHLNPVRAGLCKDINDLEKWRWSGHIAVMGKEDCRWFMAGETVRHFGKRRTTAIENYKNFLHDGINSKDHLIAHISSSTSGGNDTALSDERVMGDAEFVRNAISASLENNDRRVMARQKGLTVERIIDYTAATLSMERAELFERNRSPRYVLARGMVAYWAHELLGVSYAAIGRKFGLRNVTLINAANKAKRYIEQHKLTIIN
jgi:REP element-mobilizing transposase RayT